jgi:ribonuclease R
LLKRRGKALLYRSAFFDSGGAMSNKTFEKRKKIIYDFICDDMYVPMKFKEMAMVLQVNKEQRDELRQVLESLEGR